jgi:hypothetical protein
MLKIQNSRYKFYNINVMASRMLIYFWSKFTDMSFFTMYVIACVQTSSVNVSDPDESSPVNVVKIEN